jgi:hypothetical protein
MGGARWWLYGAVLATGGAFSILFTGETYRGGDGGFGDLSVVSIIAGNKAFLPFLLAAAVAMLVGSAGRWRFLLIIPATVVYTLVAVYGTDFVSDLFSISGWKEIFSVLGSDIYEAANIMYTEPIPYGLAPGLFLILVPVVMVLVAFATVVIPWLAGSLDAWVLLSWLVLPIALRLIKTVREHADGPTLNHALAGTALMELLFCVLLSVGILLS